MKNRNIFTNLKNSPGRTYLGQREDMPKERRTYGSSLFNIESVLTNSSPRHGITFIYPQERMTGTSWRLGGPHSQSGRFGEEKYFFSLQGFQPRYISPKPSCYTDWAIVSSCHWVKLKYFCGRSKKAKRNVLATAQCDERGEVLKEENKRVWGRRNEDGLRCARFALKSADLNTWRKVLPTGVDCSRDLHPLNREQLILEARRFSICVTLHSDYCVLHTVTRWNGLLCCLKIKYVLPEISFLCFIQLCFSHYITLSPVFLSVLETGMSKTTSRESTQSNKLNLCICLTTVSLAQSIQRRMTIWLVNNELQRIWKEAVVIWSTTVVISHVFWDVRLCLCGG